MTRSLHKSPHEFVDDAGRHIGMYTWRGTYLEACALVSGYAVGSGDDDLFRGFSHWLADRQGESHKHAFFHLVLRELPESFRDPRTFTVDQNNDAVEKLHEFLTKADRPKFTGEIVFERRAPHCWGPRGADLMAKMVRQIEKYAPAGADVKGWKSATLVTQPATARRTAGRARSRGGWRP